jgi:hypothetical protein
MTMAFFAHDKILDIQKGRFISKVLILLTSRIITIRPNKIEASTATGTYAD